MHSIMSSDIVRVFTSSFLKFGFLFFLLVALAKEFPPYYIARYKSGVSGCSCLVLHLKGNAFKKLQMDVNFAQNYSLHILIWLHRSYYSILMHIIIILMEKSRIPGIISLIMVYSHFNIVWFSLLLFVWRFLHHINHWTVIFTLWCICHFSIRVLIWLVPFLKCFGMVKN